MVTLPPSTQFGLDLSPIGAAANAGLGSLELEGDGLSFRAEKSWATACSPSLACRSRFCIVGSPDIGHRLAARFTDARITVKRGGPPQIDHPRLWTFAANTGLYPMDPIGRRQL